MSGEYDDDYFPEDDEESCYYGFGACIDPDCRDIESCLGCELLYPPDEEGDVHDYP